ncbi:hypothetical protein AFL42_09270 [Oceanobacillus caeni]|uniref:KTSC domain-containing protein n=1 Tax=Oceanobacillus caeni TaxID=405946 RepID=A0ABR5MJ37_9BACI|nr:hypothetical protein [Oceanobacillus caeni]KPH74976.1 hypothetical protein AFL42_09270 [Oceanobacillus caeni]
MNVRRDVVKYYYNPEVKYLLINQSNEKVAVFYNKNQKPFELPMIGNRPPYYCNPRYEAYYPVI